MHPEIASNPLAFFLRLTLLAKVLPKLEIYAESYPQNNFPNFGKRAANWNDISNLSKETPLYWNGTMNSNSAPQIVVSGYKINPLHLLYIWSINPNISLDHVSLLKKKSILSPRQVNPFHYELREKSSYHSTQFSRQFSPYDPERDRNVFSHGVPLSSIFDDIMDIFTEEPNYPPEAFWDTLGNYHSDGIEKVTLFFKNSPIWCEKMKYYLEFRNSEKQKD